MAKANSGKQGSGNTGKQQKQSLQRRKSRTRKKAAENTTRKKKVSLAEVLAVLTDLLSEVRAMRLAVDQQSGIDRQSVTEIALTPDKTSSSGDSRPELKAGCEAEGDRGQRNFEGGPSNPSHVPGSIPDVAPSSHTNSGNCEPPTEAAIEDAHKLAFNAGLAKRAHRPLDVLVCFYEQSLKGNSVHTRKQLIGVPDSSGHIIGKLLRQMGEMDLLEPAGKPITVTDKAKADNRLNAPVRSWKLTALGKAIAELEVKLREQAAEEKRASSTGHGAIGSVASVPDTE